MTKSKTNNIENKPQESTKKPVVKRKRKVVSTTTTVADQNVETTTTHTTKTVKPAKDGAKKTTKSTAKTVKSSITDKKDNIKTVKNDENVSKSLKPNTQDNIQNFTTKKNKNFDEIKKKIESKISYFTENAKGKFDFKLLVSVAKLMEAGAHIGLNRVQWNPKMKLFIYHNKNQKRQIIDVLKILVFLNRAYNYLFDISKEGGKILFVSTKNDIIKKLIKDNAERCNYFYVTQRWLGGTLTNYKTIVKSINKLNRLTSLVASPDIERYSKKEQLLINKKINKLEKFIGGIKNMNGLPHVVVVADPVVEHNAVSEAKALNIPVVGIANTNANPNLLDFIIPGNTFSVRSLWLLLSVLIDAIAAARSVDQLVVGRKDDEINLPVIPKQPRVVSTVRGFRNK